MPRKKPLRHPRDPSDRYRANKPPDEVTEFRENEAWRLRHHPHHMTQYQIAKELGVTESCVSRALERKRRREAVGFEFQAHAIRVDHTKHLEDYAVSLEKAYAKTKDASLIPILLKVLEQIRQIWGANAPESIDVNTNINTVTSERVLTKQQMLEEINKRIADLKRKKQLTKPKDRDHETGQPSL